MIPTHARAFGGGAAESAINPLVLVVMILAIVLILVLPRKWAIVPFLFIGMLIPVGQVIVVGGVHFFVLRVIILFGCLRLIVSKMISPDDLLGGGYGTLDRLFLWCTLCQGIAAILLFLDSAALINQFGFLLDYLGGFFILRFLIHDKGDLLRAIKCFAVIALIVGICMVREQLTMQNVFGYIGGSFVPTVREGRIRSKGPFSHELLAGAFGATLLPLFCLLWKNGKAKILASVGLIGSVLVTWTSNSSTSLLAFAAGLLGICLWPLRNNMRKVRWGIVIGLVALQCVMKAPVWFLIARVDLTGSSSGYHRAVLVDAFIRHFGDWWLIGVKDTSHWGWDLWDAQNQFVSVGENGGLLAFCFFVAMIAVCFSRLGKARKALKDDTSQEWFFWFFGAALFSHIAAFFGVNYFDQSKLAWFALLAMISAATAPLLQAATETEETPARSFARPTLAYSSRSISSPPTTGKLQTRLPSKSSFQN